MSPEFLVFYPLTATEGQCVVANDEFRVLTSPVRYSVSTLGTRIGAPGGGAPAVYSSDTEPCEALIRLAHGAHLREYAADKPTPGHCTPEQVDQVACQCNMIRPVLVHCAASMYLHHKEVIARVHKRYAGQMQMATEGEAYVISET